MTGIHGPAGPILVVEDDPTNRTVLARQLAMIGIAAEMAVNGEEGLRRWREGGFTLVLSDLHMPVSDGFALVRAIRSEEAGRPRTPVLACSADVRVGQVERVREAGFDAFLTKPLQLAGLREALERWMPRAGSLDAGGAAGGGGHPTDVAPRVFDVNALRGIVGDEPEVMVEIVAYFDTVAMEIRAEMLRAAGAGDGVDAVMLAHRLKSSARSVGALPLGELCEALENNGSRGTGEPLAQRIASVVDALDAALAAMRQWRGARMPADDSMTAWSGQ